jgi:hypothetical protein
MAAPAAHATPAPHIVPEPEKEEENMNYPNAIVLAAALIAGAVVIDKTLTVAEAQTPLLPPPAAPAPSPSPALPSPPVIPEGYGFRAGNAVAGERLWWVETRVQSNRVHMCVDTGGGIRCRHEDVPR